MDIVNNVLLDSTLQVPELKSVFNVLVENSQLGLLVLLALLDSTQQME